MKPVGTQLWRESIYYWENSSDKSINHKKRLILLGDVLSGKVFLLLLVLIYIYVGKDVERYRCNDSIEISLIPLEYVMYVCMYLCLFVCIRPHSLSCLATESSLMDVQVSQDSYYSSIYTYSVIRYHNIFSSMILYYLLCSSPSPSSIRRL